MTDTEYKGPGKWAAASGASDLYGTAGVVGGAIAGAAAGYAFKGRLAGLGNWAMPASALAGAAIVGSVAQMVGFGKGWAAAEAGQAQFDALVAENKALKQQMSWAERVTQQQGAEKGRG